MFQFYFSLSCIEEGNGSPLQCSCLENSRDGGAWWAAVYGVAQSRTRLKRLSSSNRAIPSFLGGAGGKEPTCQCRRHGFDPQVGKIPWRRKWQLTLVSLPGKFHGQRGLVGYNPWGSQKSQTPLTKQQRLSSNFYLLYFVYVFNLGYLT